MKKVKLQAVAFHGYCPHCGASLTMPVRTAVPESFVWTADEVFVLEGEDRTVGCPACRRTSAIALPKRVMVD